MGNFNQTQKEWDRQIYLYEHPEEKTLREKMKVTENKEFTKNYYDLSKRSIGNAITIHFQDGSSIGPLSIEYPLGHRFRRVESIPFLMQKFEI